MDALSERCQRCGKELGDHKSKTLHCPYGGFYSDQWQFEGEMPDDMILLKERSNQSREAT